MVELCHIHATSCIGCRFALLEMVVTIAWVVFLLPALCHSQQVHSGKNATPHVQSAEFYAYLPFQRRGESGFASSSSPRLQPSTREALFRSHAGQVEDIFPLRGMMNDAFL